ncbi:hypothetical protein FGK63_13455 [Ruegeria sediminis]|uniref:Uncharacterized protein n=1 Tax=Ruegeria sediminis TaxID=2583820 RepID=A0ABY2WXX8_9RHOB|nr:DUF6638 family protein [Ruegeria sediminis]TMV07114.1 hypothetical protein FGK63_13455 [Ruegeria sediminis]
MIHLIEKGLMFGNLVHISSPALVERYNRALQHLSGKSTALTDFHIDISGYSPEIGDELGDDLYLNPNGVNRQFILLTTEQKRSPLLNVKFSTSRDILREFIEMNEAQLFALTATDAVAGELVNSVIKLSSPRDLLNLRKIEIEADTVGGTLRKAEQLAGMVERFMTEEDAWFDDVLIARMIDTAKQTGDVTRNPVRLRHTEFEQRNFWTAHFGGLYLFPDLDHPAVICARGKPEGLPVRFVFDLSERNRIAKFFDLNELVEPIVKARGVDAAAVLQQKMDFITIDTAAAAGIDLTGLDRTDMRRLARNHADRLPAAYHGLAEMLRWAAGEGPWPRITSDHPAFFYTLRAADTPNRDLVNMLLAELAPLDPRQLFICHKELFYRTYATWPEAKRAYVADFLAREYQVDKAGARAALFGHEPDMSGEDRASEAMIRRVGPWGAVRRG